MAGPWDEFNNQSGPWSDFQQKPSQGPQYREIKVLEDGTSLIEMRNGKMAVLNQREGFSSTNPEDIAAVERGESPLQTTAKRRGQEQLLQQAPMTARAQQVVEGVPFVGSYLDELGGLVGGPELQQKTRALSEAKRDIDPVESTALNVGGSIASTVALAPFVATRGLTEAMRQMPRLQRYLTGAATAGGLGAAEGAIYGAGAGTEGERLRSAGEGAMMGGAFSTLFGAAAPMVAEIAGAGWANVRRLLVDTDLQQIQQAFGISKDAAKVLRDVSESTGMELEDALGAIQRAGQQGMVADADDAFASVLDASMRMSPAAGATGRAAVEGRAKQAGASIEQTLDEQLFPMPARKDGVPPDATDLAAAEASRFQNVRRETYKVALNEPVRYDQPLGRDIESFLNDRIEPALLNKAIKDANAEMREFGIGNQQIMATIGEDGNIAFQEMPNMMQLHYLKQAIGEQGYGAGAKVEGVLTQEARRARNQYRDLANMMGEMNPTYKRASQLGGDNIAAREAIDLGSVALANRITAQELRRDLQALPEDARQFVKMGLRAGLQDMLDRSKGALTTDVDIAEAIKLTRELSSNAMRNKIRMIMGPSASRDLFKELDKVTAALQLRAATATNSQTAQRQTFKESVAEVTDPSALATLAQGQIPAATAKAIQTATGATGDVTARRSQSVGEMLVRAMTAARGTDAEEQVKALYAAVRAGTAKQEDFDRVSQAIMNDVTIPVGVFGLSVPLARENQE